MIGSGNWSACSRHEGKKMCEFCTAHGEGKKWYLEMKTYAEELPHEELCSAQEEMVNASTRLEWTRRFFEQFTIPAATGVPATLGFMDARIGTGSGE